MKIKLDDHHYLESDQYNLWVTEERTSKNGKKYSMNVTGYYNNIEDLLNDYAGRSFMASNAKSFTALKKEMAATRKQISKWKDAITFKQIREMDA